MRGSGTTESAAAFHGVPEAVWEFRVGGYQVCEKWLKDRKGRELSTEDIVHYQQIVVAVSETIRVMGEIDAVIEAHGGWPSAFMPAPARPVLVAAVAGGRAAPTRVVEPRARERYSTCVPLVPLQVAAGAFREPQHADDDGSEWVAPDTAHRLRPGMFVAQVTGKSMEPAIPDGAYCLFASPVTGTRQGKTVLVELRDDVDPETGERYTVKRYESTKAAAGDGWHHERIMLRPINPAFKPIELALDDADRLRVVAELIEVLGNE